PRRIGRRHAGVETSRTAEDLRGRLAMIGIVKDWLARLSPNERRLIAAAGALAAVLAATLLVVNPLRAAHADAARAHESAARLLEDVRAAAALAAARGPQAAGAATAADVRGVVTRSALARGLAIARMSPVEGGLSVRLERAD